MPSPLFIPKYVTTEIASHIEQAVAKAVSGYQSASEDEDALTGQLGGSLRTSTHRADGWTWSVEYTKFRGRGAGATENLIGADGIFEVHVRHNEGELHKSLLFQAKNNWKYDPKLVQQGLLLSTWREAAFVLNYTPNTIETFRLDNVIASEGHRSRALPSLQLSQLLGEDFLLCHIGDLQLTYDAKRRVLTWNTMDGEFVMVRFSIPSRIRINVTASARRPVGRGVREGLLALQKYV